MTTTEAQPPEEPPDAAALLEDPAADYGRFARPVLVRLLRSVRLSQLCEEERRMAGQPMYYI